MLSFGELNCRQSYS